MSQTTKIVIKIMIERIKKILWLVFLAYLALAVLTNIDSIWGDISQQLSGFNMASFFMWGGFVFCGLWHLLSFPFLFVSSPYTDDAPTFLMMLNVGLSGISLCFFGMQAFA
jgi:small basic protein